MLCSILLGALLGTGAARADTIHTLQLPKQSLSLYIEEDLELTVSPDMMRPPDVSEPVLAVSTSSGQINTAYNRYRKGQRLMLVGGWVFAPSLVVFIFSLHKPVLNTVALVTGGLGVSAALAGVGVMMSGGWIADDALRGMGIWYPRLPQRMIVGGAALTAAGLTYQFISGGELNVATMLGALSLSFGWPAELLIGTRALRKHSAETGRKLTWSLVPVVTPGVQGATVSARF